MLGRFLPIFCALAVVLASMALAADPAALAPSATQPPSTEADPAAPSLVLLRNGEFFTGRVTKEKDRYIVAADGTEIRLAARDVDIVCGSLDEAYTIQRDRIPATRADDRLRLANWCLQHRLLGYAAAELATVMQTNPRHPGIASLDRRLQQAIEQANKPQNQEPRTAQKPNPAVTKTVATDNPAAQPIRTIDPASPALPNPPPPADESTSERRLAKPRVPIGSSELDRLSRNLPPGTVEHFIETIQPILMNSCSTVGCHGPASKSQYALIRPAANGRITPRGTSQRNLFNTFEWLDHKRPAESGFLAKAREPHGGKPVGVLAENSLQYQQLVAWVRLATGAKAGAATTAPATIDVNSPGTRAQVSSPFPPSSPAPYLNPPGQSEPQKPIEKPAEEKPFYEQPPGVDSPTLPK